MQGEEEKEAPRHPSAALDFHMGFDNYDGNKLKQARLLVVTHLELVICGIVPFTSHNRCLTATCNACNLETMHANDR
eukprot:4680958-Amphidinium_carterae.1